MWNSRKKITRIICVGLVLFYSCTEKAEREFKGYNDSSSTIVKEEQFLNEKVDTIPQNVHYFDTSSLYLDTIKCEVYNPDGTYYPLEKILIQNRYSIHHMSIMRFELTEHYKPKQSKDPKLILVLNDDISGEQKRIDINSFSATKQNLDLLFQIEGSSKIRIKGSFLGKCGPYLDSVRIKKDVVLKGQIMEDGQEAKDVFFTWWQGD